MFEMVLFRSTIYANFCFYLRNNLPDKHVSLKYENHQKNPSGGIQAY